MQSNSGADIYIIIYLFSCPSMINHHIHQISAIPSYFWKTIFCFILSTEIHIITDQQVKSIPLLIIFIINTHYTQWLPKGTPSCPPKPSTKRMIPTISKTSSLKSRLARFPTAGTINSRTSAMIINSTLSSRRRKVTNWKSSLRNQKIKTGGRPLEINSIWET